MSFSLDLLTDAEQSRATYLAANDDGFLARFAEWASLKTDAPSYSLMASGLMALSMSAGDVVVLPNIFGGQPVHMNLYVLLVGPSTTMRKTTVLNFVRDLLPQNQTTRQPYMTFMDDVSMQAFNRELGEAGKQMAPVLLNVDEVAGLFQQVRNRSGSYLVGFDKTLMKAYDHSPVSIHRVGQKIDVDKGAFVNVFAASTPEPLMEVLGSDDVESGLLPRFIVFDVREATRGRRLSLMERLQRDDEFGEKEEELKRFLLSIAANRARGIPDGPDPENMPYQRHVLDVDMDALARLDDIDARFTAEAGADSTAWGAIKGRAFWHIFKLSGLFALSRDGRNATVTLDDVLRACWLVEQTVSDLGRMQNEVGSSVLERRINEVLATIEETRGRRMKVSAIARKLKLSARDLGELSATLLHRELVEIEKNETGSYWRIP